MHVSVIYRSGLPTQDSEAPKKDYVCRERLQKAMDDLKRMVAD